MKEVSEIFFAFGHENVRATHKTTVEFTKDKALSQAGECILAIKSEKSLEDLGNQFKKNLCKPNAKLKIIIEADGIAEQVNAQGSPNLALTHPSDMVVRKSSYIDDRTLAVCADKAARDLSRNLVKKVQNPKQKVKITLTVYC